MQTEQEILTPLQRRIEMSLPVADIDKGVEQRLKKLAQTVKMAGFRPGKVPLRLVAQQYGTQVRSEVIAEAVQRAFGEAVRDKNLRVAGYPTIEPKSAENVSHLEFSATFEVYPEIKPGDVSSSSLDRPVIEIGEGDVDKTIEVLRKQRITYEPTERTAEDGDRVTIDFVGRIDGEVFDGGQASGFPVILGAGTMLPDFEAQLKGMGGGAEKCFELTFPADYHAKDLAGKNAQFDVTVRQVEAPRLPELDESFARALGVGDGDLARMRDEVKANLEREVKKRIQSRVKERVMNLLLEVNPIDAPRALVDLEAQQMAEKARQDLQNRGVNSKDMPIEPAWFSEQAARRVKLGLIVAEIVKENRLEPKPQQVRALIEESAKSYEDPAEVVRWYYSQPQRLAEAEGLVIEGNVVDWVLANAKTADEPVPFDELMGTGP